MRNIVVMKRVLMCVSFSASLALASGAAAQPPSAAPPSSAKPPAPPSSAPPSSAAQQKPPEAPPAAPGAQAQPVPPPPPVTGGFTYNPEGRRDPFISLIGRGSDPRSSGAARAAGVPGLLINEVTVKGIIKDRSGFIAMIQAPDNKTYVVRVGDHLLDGTVKSIASDAVVFSQDVNDPLSLVKQKEIRKPLRSTQEGRG